MAGNFIARISVQGADAYEAYRVKATTTTEQYGGRYLVRGGETELREGSWPGRTVVVEFPDLAAAQAWYESEDYQAILPFRLVASQGDAILVEGVR